MVVTHERSPSPEVTEPSLLKRMKMSHISSEDPTPYFASDLLNPNTIHKLNAEYASSAPFKHAIVEKLFQDAILKGVKDECLSELSFTEKETDIYKVNQTGDLASLNYLTEHQISLLPNLLTLRDALYSAKFRDFLRAVTGCGPLSGSKQDMSVNTYRKGCHLLNHDDVIGTRRVSYILYMPLPSHQMWQKEWGGALELYPTQLGTDGNPEPAAIPSKCVPPSWNQFIFFEVQPGKSFHSVEEVVVGEGEDGRQRLSISGWFHAAQPGEPGYEPEAQPEVKSSREQLVATSTAFRPYPETDEPPLPDTPLSEEHITFLSEYLNPVYLQQRTLKALASRFVEESSLELHSFLATPIADRLAQGLAENDKKSGLGPDRPERIPPHSAGTEGDWFVRGPPHKWRYCTIKKTDRAEAVSPLSAHTSPDAIVRCLQDELFPSPAFRAWLANVSQLLPLQWHAEARRFRPGLDYTLATSEEKDARLDVVLGLTPNAETEVREDEEEPAGGWSSGEWGGWECYMAPHEGEDDPAVYRSGGVKKTNETNGNGDTRMDGSEDQDDEDVDADGDADDGTLLTVQPGFNRLLLVLRDQGVMRFVKYVSAAADGSRWDVCGEYECGAVEVEVEVEED
ncbi:nuclear protein [Cristinia sonorae]|uniref:uS12 prolyl 3,4-dihydroxylase n=1 Tax=Cristinia sonorae TaxID=1940300 RepID=A0A8K0UY94_9AGAR|nr:nuclear protein [Cristinia sonorae]